MDQQFDLVVIGGGSGGVAAARRAAGYGAKVALVERDRLGGTCVNRGCIPKKLLMYASQYRHAFDLAEAFGWTAGEARFDMSRWQDAKSAELDRLESIYRGLLGDTKVAVFRGLAEIVDLHRVQVGNQALTYERLLIATGSRPAVAPIPGLEGALTSDDVLNLRVVPKRMAIIGAGYIGVEFASMFARLGSEVSLFFRSANPLRGFDEDLRVRLSAALEHAGVRVFSSTDVESVAKAEGGYLLRFSGDRSAAFDAVLNATGRIPNTDQLDLVRLGLAVPPGAAIPVNAYSETTAPGIYAVGDVTDRINLTPVAIAEGRAFADTVFGGQDVPFHDDQVATAVFTDPPIGTVGLSEQEAAARRATIIYASQFRPMALAFSGRKEYSHIKLVVDAKSDRVLGIHMIGSDAPEIIQSLAVSLRSNVTKHQFDQTIAVHPTTAEEFVLLREPLRRLPGPM